MYLFCDMPFQFFCLFQTELLEECMKISVRGFVKAQQNLSFEQGSYFNHLFWSVAEFLLFNSLGMLLKKH